MTIRRMGIAACVLAVLLLAAALVTGGMAESATPGKSPRIDETWIRLPAVPGRPAGGYFIMTGSRAADRLIAVTSPLAARIEMHRSVHDGGVMRMEAQDSVALPAGAQIAFEPGGHHLMLFGLDPAVKPGTTLPLRFTFAQGGTIEARAQVHAMGGGPGEGHGGHH